MTENVELMKSVTLNNDVINLYGQAGLTVCYENESKMPVTHEQSFSSSSVGGQTKRSEDNMPACAEYMVKEEVPEKSARKKKTKHEL
ncbi:hypothetical protein ACFDWB_003848 [Salmonella enterica]